MVSRRNSRARDVYIVRMRRRLVHSRTLIAGAIALGGAAAGLRAAQPTRATITGIVRDSASTPAANADVIARPSGRRTRSDSAGRFVLAGLEGGKYTVVGRKLGYTPTDY